MKLNLTATCAYLVVLLCGSLASYHKPIFADQFDILPYMGAANLCRTADPAPLHSLVYSEAKSQIPSGDYATLLENATGYRQDVAANPWHFAQILPFYNGRSLYILAIRLLHFGPAHLPLARAIVMTSVLSYFLLGALLFAWLTRYIASPYAAAFSSLLVMSPPVMNLARTPTPDALSAAFIISALYFGFEKRSLLWSCVLLLASIYVRTDNMLLAIAVIGYFAFSNEEEQLTMRKTHAAVLIAVALASVAMTNRLSGNYGWKTLFCHTFVAPISNPAEVIVKLSPTTYLSRIAVGHISKASSITLFSFIGTIGVLACRRARNCTKMRDLAIILFAVTAIRYFLFPSFLDRHYAGFYVLWAITMMAGLADPLRIRSTALATTDSSL